MRRLRRSLFRPKGQKTRRLALHKQGAAFIGPNVCGADSLCSLRPSSSGLGHHPFTVKTRVRFPLGVPPRYTSANPAGSPGLCANGLFRRSSISDDPDHPVIAVNHALRQGIPPLVMVSRMARLDMIKRGPRAVAIRQQACQRVSVEVIKVGGAATLLAQGGGRHCPFMLGMQ